MAAAAIGVATFVLGRGASATVTSIDVEGRTVAVECVDGRVAVDRCSAWGASVLSEQPRSRTFELEDVTKLEIDGPLDGNRCRIAYFISRYPDDPVSTQEQQCPAGP